MIPKKLHFVWLGSELPTFHRLLMDRWRAFHPGWEIKLWNEADCLGLIKGMGTGLEGRFQQQGLTFSTKSDLARYHIVGHCGGIYLDTDFLALRPLDPLLRYSVFAVCEQPGRVCSGVFGAQPGHQLFPHVYECLRFRNYNQGPVSLAGPDMFGPICQQILPLDYHSAIMADYTFFPVLYGQRNWLHNWMQRDARQSYAVHLWAGAWNDAGDDVQLASRAGAMLLNPTSH